MFPKYFEKSKCFDMSIGKTSSTDSKLLKSLKAFKDEVSELYLPKEVPVIKEVPTPFEFYRNWVAPNIPVLIKGGIRGWPAVKKWNKEYFCKHVGDKQISVSVTPNGYGDAITEIKLNEKTVELFVIPDEKLLTIGEFYEKLEKASCTRDLGKTEGVYYIQKQNSNLTEEFPELLPDIDTKLHWASETFQSKPTAINLWIGDKRAISSLHKDPFENIYCVVSGAKEFILLPPTDRPWLPYKNVPVGQYNEKSPGVFEVNLFKNSKWTKSNHEKENELCTTSGHDHDAGDRVPWIAVDPVNPDYNRFPLYKHASPITVRVEQGDILYLPSLWFHYVTQSHKCIAVNYWYDMNLDIKYAYFQLLESLSEQCKV